MFAYGAAAVVIISFAGLAVFWRSARWGGGVAGRAVVGVRRAWARAAFAITRGAGLAAFAIVLGAAAFGDPTTADNIAPVFVYVTFWVGFILANSLVGDVWHLFNPFDTLAALIDRARRGVGRLPAQPIPPRVGLWPAVAGLAGFVWMELVYPERAQPRVLALAITVYTVSVLAGVARHGQAWVARAEAFTAFFGLLSRMAPLYVDDHRILRARVPLAGLAALPRLAGTEALVLVALGSTTFDGVSRTRLWADATRGLARWPLVGVSTLGLAWAVAMVAVAYLVAMKVTAHLYDRALAGRDLALAATFVHSLVPIAFAYAVAHYSSLLAFEGQAAIALASDPFGRGWNLFGTAAWVPNYSLLPTTTVAYVQAGGIVAGHVAGVVVAHDRALALFPGRQAARSQYPLLAAMVLFTVCGLALLLGT